MFIFSKVSKDMNPHDFTNIIIQCMLVRVMRWKDEVRGEIHEDHLVKEGYHHI